MASDFSLPPPREKEIQTALLQYLNARGHFAWRNNTGVFKSTYKGKERYIRFNAAGASDIIGISKTGRFLAIEVKRPGKKPTPEQKEFLANIASHGGLALVATSLDDIMKIGL